MTKDEFQKAVDDVIEDCLRNDYTFGSYARRVTEAVWPVLEEAEASAAWYERRCSALQEQQSNMRDPERTIVCDILANGAVLPPDFAGDRYAIKDTSEESK